MVTQSYFGYWYAAWWNIADKKILFKKKVDSVLLIRYICFPLQHCAVVNMFMNTCATLSQKAVIHPNHLSILRRHAKKNRVIWFAFLTKIKCNGFQTNSGILIIGLKMAFSHSFFWVLSWLSCQWSSTYTFWGWSIRRCC